MICIIANSYKSAERWAAGQLLEDREWFYPACLEDLYYRKDFHVIVTPDGADIPNAYLNKLITLAQRRGRMK